MDLIPLQNKSDKVQDFFENIMDIQIMKRIKALNHLKKLLEQSFTPTLMNSIQKVIIPILEFNIFTKMNELRAGGRIN